MVKTIVEPANTDNKFDSLGQGSFWSQSTTGLGILQLEATFIDATNMHQTRSLTTKLRRHITKKCAFHTKSQATDFTEVYALFYIWNSLLISFDLGYYSRNIDVSTCSKSGY